MSLANWFARRNSTRQISRWAVEVARRCHQAVSERLTSQWHEMSLPEARGYVRARAATVIDDELTTFIRDTACQPAVSRAVRECAIEEVTRMAIGDLLRAVRQPPLRKAA